MTKKNIHELSNFLSNENVIAILDFLVLESKKTYNKNGTRVKDIYRHLGKSISEKHLLSLLEKLKEAGLIKKKREKRPLRNQSYMV